MASQDISNLQNAIILYYRVVPELEILTILPDLTLNFFTLIGRPQCNGRYCWQASLFHLLPKFTRTVKKCGNGNGVRELYLYIVLVLSFPSIQEPVKKIYVENVMIKRLGTSFGLHDIPVLSNTLYFISLKITRPLPDLLGNTKVNFSKEKNF